MEKFNTSKENSCLDCPSYNKGYCKRWQSAITNPSAALTCTKFGEKIKMNKGMQIRQNKLNKQAKKRAVVKPEQSEMVCFVEYSEKVIERINGKYRRPTKNCKGKGLQIQNKIFLGDGHYKMVNRSSLKIIKTYNDIPQWASSDLIELYKNPDIATRPVGQKSPRK